MAANKPKTNAPIPKSKAEYPRSLICSFFASDISLMFSDNEFQKKAVRKTISPTAKNQNQKSYLETAFLPFFGKIAATNLYTPKPTIGTIKNHDHIGREAK